MTFSQSIHTCLLKKYATFRGCATRAEFGGFLRLQILLLFMYLILAVIYLAVAPPDVDDTFFTDNPFFLALNTSYKLWWLLMFIPFLSVTVRRLHDLDLNGWWVLLFYGGPLLFRGIADRMDVSPPIYITISFIVLTVYCLIFLCLLMKEEGGGYGEGTLKVAQSSV